MVLMGGKGGGSGDGSQGGWWWWWRPRKPHALVSGVKADAGLTPSDTGSALDTSLSPRKSFQTGAWLATSLFA